MELSDLFVKNRTPIFIMPKIEEEIFNQIREAYKEEVEPKLWKSFLDGDYDDGDQEFLRKTNSIVEKVVESFISENKLVKLNEDEKTNLIQGYWEDSQNLWWELSGEIKPIITFIKHVYKKSQTLIENSYPNVRKIFGDKTEQLLFELVFQLNLREYTQAVNPSFVDLRRIINISGQIVESIFAEHILSFYLTIGKILKELRKCSNQEYRTRKLLDQNFKGGLILFNNEFLGKLKIISVIRNKYSHGFSRNVHIEDDFSKCIRALFENERGVLNILYKLLNDSSSNKKSNGYITLPQKSSLTS